MEKNRGEDLYRILIFGAVKEVAALKASLRGEKSLIIGYIDNNAEKQGKNHDDGILILSPSDGIKLKYDLIIIALIKNVKQVRDQLKGLGVEEHKILSFFYAEDKNQWSNLFDTARWDMEARMRLLEYKLETIERHLELMQNNSVYEFADSIKKGEYKFPQIIGTDVAIETILNHKYSMCRFGDAEFSAMQGGTRVAYQKPDKEMAERLFEVFHCMDEKIMIAISPFFGSLEDYTERIADDIRMFMSPSTRKYLNNLVNYEREYYNAFLFRPYLIYKDKLRTGERFRKIKQIWENRDIVIVEGSQTRIGVGNDLLENAKSIKRILAPAEHAYDRYNEILNAAETMEKDRLFLIALGPAAAIMAYDLALNDYQAIDIGHVDIEYEWYLRNAEERVDLPNKYVNEVCGGQTADICKDPLYLEQIIFDFS